MHRVVRIFLERFLLKNKLYLITPKKFMKKMDTIRKQVVSMPTRIKVKLDHKTTIIINRLASFKIWKKRFPLAEIID
jgi:hypothetical protein